MEHRDLKYHYLFTQIYKIHCWKSRLPLESIFLWQTFTVYLVISTKVVQSG